MNPYPDVQTCCEGKGCVQTLPPSPGHHPVLEPTYRAHRYTAHDRDQDYALHNARRDYGTELTARTVLCCSTHTQKGATHETGLEREHEHAHVP